MSDIPTYPKIPGPFKRHTEGPNRNKLDRETFAEDVIEYLAPAKWTWTEKLDGTNLRIHWDGYKPTLGGRTDRAQLPTNLLQHMTGVFTEELLEQAFQDRTVTLFGEGVGAGIQKGGGKYGAEPTFVLFDVLSHRQDGSRAWLARSDVEGVGEALGVPVAPLVDTATLWAAIGIVSNGLSSAYGDFLAEGLVGVPAYGLLDKNGRRIQVKVKTVDFWDEAAAQRDAEYYAGQYRVAALG